MGKFLLKLSNFDRKDCYKISRKIIANDIIEDKNFSRLDFRNVKFFNCSFKHVSFDENKSYSLIFSNF